MHTDLDAVEVMGEVASKVGRGILLNTCAEGRANTMTIGWGTLGVEWGRPVFVAYVRQSRYTRELLDRNPEFVVSVPGDVCDRRVLDYCGSRSGRDVDKIREMDLTPVPGRRVSVPALREFPITLECRVLYRGLQDTSGIPEDILARFYPPGSDGGRDAHLMYYGEIVDAYRLDRVRSRGPRSCGAPATSSRRRPAPPARRCASSGSRPPGSRTSPGTWGNRRRSTRRRSTPTPAHP